MKTKYRYGSREPGLPCTSRVGGGGLATEVLTPLMPVQCGA